MQVKKTIRYNFVPEGHGLNDIVQIQKYHQRHIAQWLHHI